LSNRDLKPKDGLCLHGYLSFSREFWYPVSIQDTQKDQMCAKEDQILPVVVGSQ
jgi:hypothetical protein